jgi:hypothetical protein
LDCRSARLYRVRFASSRFALTIIEIQPTWRGNEYFMVGDQIVIVDRA